MRLPFRYQFILSPALIVILLAVLVGYTLLELSRINDENETRNYWELLHDNIQSSIAAGISLQKTVNRLSTEASPQQDEQFFNYLEQSQRLSDILLKNLLLDHLTSDLYGRVIIGKSLLQEPEKTTPTRIKTYLDSILPGLEYQAQIIAAQRRSVYIDNHHSLVEIISRLSTVLITALLVCIVIAAGLAAWGLVKVRRRFRQLSEHAQLACPGNAVPGSGNNRALDEIDELEYCLTSMTKRLLHVVSVENVLRGVEEERRRIAMDMHDGVLADLTTIGRQFDSLKQGNLPDAAIHDLRSNVDELIHTLRRTIDDLHPQVLEILGLDAALRSWLERQSTMAGFPQYHYDFEQEIDGQLDLNQKINLFRIITEAVTNVVKHAHGDRLELTLRLVNNHLRLTIEDNGVGMPDELNKTGHGYLNMNERARLLGATVRWHKSRFARGTCFELDLALEPVS